MRPDAVIIGLGQLGRSLAEGLVLTGWTVTGVRRDQTARDLARPDLVVVATGEDDLGPALEQLPPDWRSGRVVLLQNELLPDQWLRHGVTDPTVLVVWFSRKPGELVRELRPSIVAGPHAAAISAALSALGLHAIEVAPSDVVDALVEKNVYIWAMNLAALLVPEPTTSRVLGEYRDVYDALCRETIRIHEAALGHPVHDAAALCDSVADILVGEGERRLGGRSAKRRAVRLAALASDLGVDAPTVYRAAAGS